MMNPCITFLLLFTVLNGYSCTNLHLNDSLNESATPSTLNDSKTTETKSSRIIFDVVTEEQPEAVSLHLTNSLNESSSTPPALNDSKPNKTESSRIIVYTPPEEVPEAGIYNPEENLKLIRKIKELFISFFTRLEQKSEDLISENLNELNYTENPKIKRQNIDNLFEKAKKAIVETSQKAINTTNDVLETAVKDKVNKIYSRNASHFPTNNNDLDEINHEAHNCSQNCTISKIITLAANAMEDGQSNNDKGKSSSQIASKIDNKMTTKSLPTIQSETKHTITRQPATTAHFIDQNTKYFFGEGSTDANTIETHQTDTETAHINDTDVALKLNQNSANTSSNAKNCDGKCSKLVNQSSTNPNNNNKTENLKNLIILLSTSNQGKIKNNSTLAIKKNDIKKNADKEFFRHNDWLWEHLESIKSGRLKLNYSTDDFLKEHHFLSNSGGTDQSATATLKLTAMLFENKTVDPNYKKLLETENLRQNENTSLPPDFPLKRSRRIRRSPKKGQDKNDASKEDGDDQEINLPEGDVTTLIASSDNVHTETSSSNSIILDEKEKDILSEKPAEFSSSTIRDVPQQTELPSLESITPEIDKEPSTELTLLTETNKNINHQHKESENTIFDKDAYKNVEPVKRNGNQRIDVGIKLEKAYNDGGGIATKPLVLIVTVPTFIGIGLFILLLCFLTRTGGWCCRIFEVPRPTVSPKEVHRPSPSRRDRYVQ